MATYRGVNGLKRLKEKVYTTSKKLVSEPTENITKHLVDESVIGQPFYHSPTLDINIANDEGDFKNSWSVGVGGINKTTRPADTTGSGAIAEAIIDSSRYNLEESVYVTNSKDYAVNVEDGWDNNDTYGWKAKEGYHIVRDNEVVANSILVQTALKLKVK